VYTKGCRGLLGGRISSKLSSQTSGTIKFPGIKVRCGRKNRIFSKELRNSTSYPASGLYWTAGYGAGIEKEILGEFQDKPMTSFQEGKEKWNLCF
jgi:hypothetical protein